MYRCLICKSENNPPTVEHIIPRSLGNIHYILKKGEVCEQCNRRFAKYEYNVLNSQPWLGERKKYGLVRQDVIETSQEEPENDLRRFLCKVFIESVYHSRPNEFDSLGLELVRRELLGTSQHTFTTFKNKALSQSLPIPGWIDRFRLRRNHIELHYYQKDQMVYFQLKFAQILRILSYNSS